MHDPLTPAVRNSPVPTPSAQEFDAAAGPLLQAGLTQSLADGIYFYRLDLNYTFLELVSQRGLPVNPAPSSNPQPGQPAKHWVESLNEPAQFATSAWQDWRLSFLPEFVQNRFETAVVIPVGAGPRGILTSARLSRSEFTIPETVSLLSLQAPLGSLLAAAASREENARLKAELQKATDRLAGRKHIERAKGIIQMRYQWTEEEAYLHLRRLSLKTRKPMGEIARSMISNSTS